MIKKTMMMHKANIKLCRLCGKEKQQGTDLFTDKVKGIVLMSLINKYFSKEVYIKQINYKIYYIT